MKHVDKLPEQFCYSQQSLQAFSQCPMKFRKRYLEHLHWENGFDEESREGLQRGRDFHLLARRYFLGIGDQSDNRGSGDPLLDCWLDNLRKTFPLEPEAEYLPEQNITMHSGSLRLQATLDLIIRRQDRLEIWDWKTHHHRNAKSGAPVPAQKLEQSLQTRVYLFLLWEYAAKQRGEEPGSIRMSYWQPEPVRILAEIPYSGSRHEESRHRLEEMIAGIEAYDWNSFDRMPFAQHCKTCEFNWFCNFYV